MGRKLLHLGENLKFQYSVQSLSILKPCFQLTVYSLSFSHREFCSLRQYSRSHVNTPPKYTSVTLINIFTDFKISAGIPPPSAFHTVSQRKPSPLVTSQFVGTSSVVSLTRTSPVRVQEVAVLFNAVHPAPLRTKFNTKHRSGHSPLKCWGPFTSNKLL